MHVRTLKSTTKESITLHLDKVKVTPRAESVALSKKALTPNQSRDGFVENDDFIPLVPSSEISLSPEQNLVLNRVRDGSSVFFTGSAGQSRSNRRGIVDSQQPEQVLGSRSCCAK